MKVLVTGCAGFIGFFVCNFFLENKKIQIIGVDNINNYYSVKIKNDRLKILKKNKRFEFKKIDIANFKMLGKIFTSNKIDYVVHLAAQAGVRHSINFPEKYVNSNIIGFFNILENCRKFKTKHLIFASTSSVYGNNKVFPLEEGFNTDKPLSFYAATKKSNEVMAYSFSNIFNLPCTALRFFTVYGEWGRPDMSLFKFTKAIIEGKSLDLYGYGKHVRDFTYVGDVVKYISAILIKPSLKKIPFDIYNLCSNEPIRLKYFIKLIEEQVGKKAKFRKLSLQPGDVLKTHGDNINVINKTTIKKSVNIKIGIKRFVNWYKRYYKIK